MLLSHESVSLVLSELDLSVLFDHDTEAFLHIVVPVAFVPTTSREEERAISFSFSLDPLTFVSISQCFCVCPAVYPHMCSVSMLLITAPLSCVSLVGCDPYHCALSLLYIILPHSFVEIPWRVDHSTKSTLQPVFEESFEGCSISKFYTPFTIPLSFFPLSNVGGILSLRYELSEAVFVACYNVS